MKMYLDSGYVNMEGLITNQYPFVFVTGGRGTGKTYGALETVLKLQKEGKLNRFMFLRRTQKEADKISSGEQMPFKALIDKKQDLNITVKNIKDGFYSFKNDDELIGYLGALSTFRNLRGVEFPDVNIIIYDEFIPEDGSYTIKNEFNAFNHMYETINRNRELDGKPPVKFIGLSNSYKLSNKIFLGLNILPSLEKILIKGGGSYYSKERGLQVTILKDSPISAAKQNTALYRLNGDNDFTHMALGNEFKDFDMDLVRPSDLKQYNLITTITGMAVYRHKSKFEYYCCSYDKKAEFSTSERDLERFRIKYYFLSNRYIDGEIYFDNILTKYAFLAYNDIR